MVEKNETAAADAGQKSAEAIDMINGPIFRSLVLFSLPILGSNLFQQFYNTVDAAIVGNCLGDLSLAAIGVCAPVYDLLVGFGLGIGNGLTIVTARSYGSGDRELLKRSVAGCLAIGAVVSLVLTLIARLSLYPLLRILNTPPDILDEAYRYISTITLFTAVMFAYNLCAGLLRAIGNSVMPLVFLVLSSCLNIGLDILFVARWNMGVKGAAVATVISQGVSVALCLGYIWKRTPVLIPERRHFAVELSLYAEMLGQGFSMGFMSSIVSAGSVILQYGINGLGYLVIAGHTAARKLYQFSVMPVASLGMAFSTFVSQNRGADRGDRVIQGIRTAYLSMAVMAGLTALAMWPCSPFLVQWLSGSSEPVILENGASYLRFCSPFYAVLGWLVATRNCLQGLGQKILPLASSVIELIGKILFVLIFIPKYSYGAVILCEPVIWCVMEAQLIVSFFRNPYISAWRSGGRRTKKEGIS